MAKHVRSTEAYLFQQSAGSTVCTAQFGGVNCEALVPWVEERVRGRLAESQTTVVTDIPSGFANPNVTEVDGRGYQLRFLVADNNQFFGALVLPQDALSPSHEVLRVMANRLARS